MTSTEKRIFDDILGRVGNLANLRCARLAEQWRKQRPKSSLEIKFGMGSEYIEVNGKQTGGWDDHLPAILREFLADLNDITHGYTLACPDDMKIDKP